MRNCEERIEYGLPRFKYYNSSLYVALEFKNGTTLDSNKEQRTNKWKMFGIKGMVKCAVFV